MVEVSNSQTHTISIHFSNKFGFSCFFDAIKTGKGGGGGGGELT